MYNGAKIAAIVPAYKEAAHIAKVIKTMPKFVDFIVVVDDCSPDETSQAAAATKSPRLTLIRHEKNLGVGGAIITGHKAALDLGADVNVIMAGDGQMDPDYLPQLLDRVVLDGYGFAKANRFFSSTSFSGMPRHRVFGNIVLSFMTKFASGYWNLFDPQNGYTAVRTSVLRRMPLEQVAERYSFENDFLIQLSILDVPATDVPIPAVYGEEVSSIRLGKVVPELMRLLVVGFWKRIWYRHVIWSFSPIALLLVFGILLTAIGLGISGWLFVLSFDSTGITAGTVMLAALPTILGSQMLISALQLDIQATPSKPRLDEYPRFKR